MQKQNTLQRNLTKIKAIRKRLPKNKSKASSIPDNVNVNGNKITDQRLILEEFNTFFSQVGQNLVKEFSLLNYEDYKIFVNNKVKSLMFMEPPRINEVKNLIYSPNLRKSVGHDNTLPYYLRIASTILSPVLCYFIDNAFRLGVFPRSCKIAKIAPLYISGKTELLNNYRLISILNFFKNF